VFSSSLHIEALKICSILHVEETDLYKKEHRLDVLVLSIDSHAIIGLLIRE
jgi:hypothetical protein